MDILSNLDKMSIQSEKCSQLSFTVRTIIDTVLYPTTVSTCTVLIYYTCTRG